MNKKYILTEETLNWYGRTLHRIKALRSFNDVKEGDLGGWIEDEKNLSHNGNCWVYDEAKVCDNARVFGSAVVYDNAVVYGNAKVYGNAWIFSSAKIYGKTEIKGQARISQTANISKTEDYLTIGPLGSRDDFTTFFKGETVDILVNCGCFSGTIEEFEKRVEEVHGRYMQTKHANTYHIAILLAKTNILD